MKKIFLSLALAVSMMASAQVFEVGQLIKLNTPTDTDVKVAGVSADGSYVLITNGSNHGLRRYDVATGKTTTITTAAGAGYNVQISKDGQELVYRETNFDAQGLRKNDIVRLDLATAQTATIAKGQRDMMAMANTGAKVSVSINDRRLFSTRTARTSFLLLMAATRAISGLLFLQMVASSAIMFAVMVAGWLTSMVAVSNSLVTIAVQHNGMTIIPL